MKRHFVTFLSPGTFVAENTTKEMDSWSVERAIEMSKSIKERHGALPYGFYFTTRTRAESDLDSKESDRSGTYYLGGEIMTVEDIKKRNSSSDRILISNMECNGWEKVIVNTNSWKWTQPFEETDTLLDL